MSVRQPNFGAGNYQTYISINGSGYICLIRLVCNEGLYRICNIKVSASPNKMSKLQGFANSQNSGLSILTSCTMSKFVRPKISHLQAFVNVIMCVMLMLVDQTILSMREWKHLNLKTVHSTIQFPLILKERKTKHKYFWKAPTSYIVRTILETRQNN